MHRNVRSSFVLVATAVVVLCTFAADALAETRTLKLHHLHTREKAEIAYKRNGRYLPEGLKQINYMLRDWRRNEPIRMDPRLLDLVWEAYRQTGSNAYINVVSGYRAPATNAMLRSRSKGVAEKSQHMLGKAMDFFIPGVPLKKLRDIGLRMQGGGVGYYPTSGSPFVHMDVGNVRHWPGISRQELAQVFPNGKTLHVPSDGKPLPGYEQALAAYKGRKATGTPNIELASVAGPSKRKSGGLLAAFFGGGGADEADDVADVASAAPAPRKPARPTAQAPVARPAAPAAAAPAIAPAIAVVPPDQAQRLEIPRPAPAAPAETIVAALPQREVPVPRLAPRPSIGLAAEVPETLPFSEAAAPEPVAAPEVAAMVPAHIPLPTWRPEAAPSAPGESTLLAMVSHEDEARGGDARKDGIKRLLESAAVETVSPPPVEVAFAIPEKAPVPGLRGEPAVAAAPVPEIVAAAASADKQPRPALRDSKAAPKSVAVPVQPGASAWPLRVGSQAVPVPADQPPVRLAASFIRQAPQQVYVEGFRRDRAQAEHHRFTGSAVNFLPLASFR